MAETARVIREHASSDRSGQAFRRQVELPTFSPTTTRQEKGGTRAQEESPPPTSRKKAQEVTIPPMKKKVFSCGVGAIYIGYTDSPIKAYDRSIIVKHAGDKPTGMSVSYMNRAELPPLLDVFVAFANTEDLPEFLAALIEAGFKDQAQEPFRTEWELERALEKVAALEAKLCGQHSQTPVPQVDQG